MSLMSFQKAYSFPVVFTRAANIFGPGQQLYRIIPRTILYARLGKNIALHGGGLSDIAYSVANTTDGGYNITGKQNDLLYQFGEPFDDCGIDSDCDDNDTFDDYNIDPNNDNWNDCGSDGICPNNDNYIEPDQDGSELNGLWDENEGTELKG